MRKVQKLTWLIAIIVGLTLVASPAMAKKKGEEDEAKKSVADSIKKKTEKTEKVDERTEEEKAASKKAAEEATKDLTEGPGDAAGDAETADVDPEKVNELLKEMEEKNRGLVQKYEKLLAKSPTNSKAPEWMFRIAEVKWETAKYKNLRDRYEWDKKIESMDAQGVPPSEWPQPPKPDFAEAIEYYKKIAATYSSYERLDEVLYKLGDGLIRAGEAKEGVSYLHRITQVYKDSKYLDRVYYALGEYYFENRNVGTAQAAYEKVVNEYPKSKVYPFALYKLAWTYYNMADDEGFRMAIDTFKKVVEELDTRYADYIDPETGILDENKLPQGEVSFRNQAINDLIVAYAEVDDGWTEFRDYMSTKLTQERLRKKMEMFAELMGGKGQNQERIAIYRWLISEDPNHPRIPTYAERIIDSHFNDDEKEMIEVVTREFIDYFDPNGKWALVNKDNETAYRQARQFAEDKLYSLAANYLLEATKAVEREDEEEARKYFQQARDDHETFLERYPDSEYAYDMNFYYAYILDENSDRALAKLQANVKDQEEFRRRAREEVLPDLKAAAQQYQKVVDLREQAPTDEEEGENHTRVSANRQVFVYANILATVDPEWSIAASGDAKNFKAEEKDSEIKEAEELSEQEKDFVAAAEQYATLFPKQEDTPGFLWRSAEIYRSRNNYNEAALRFDDLVTNFPNHQYAGQAVGSMFALYNKAENWPKIEEWAEWLIEKKNFKVYKKPELEDAIGYSIGQQSQDLYEEKKYRASAEKLYTLKERFPERESLVKPAILATANIYRDGKMVAEAIEKYEEYRRTYPTSVEAPFATFEAAQLYAQKTDFEKAAELYEGLPEEVTAVKTAAAGAPAEEEKGKKKKGKKAKKAEEAEEKADDAAEGDEPDYAKINDINQYVALFNAVQIRESLKQYDKAITNAKRYLGMNPSGGGDIYEHPEDGYLRSGRNPAPAKMAEAKLVVNREGTVYHLAELHQMAEQPEAAIVQYQAYLGEYTENRPVRIAARLAIAKELGETQDRGWRGDQDDQFEAIDKNLTAMTEDEKVKAMPLVAEMKFIQADRRFQEYKDVKLEFPVRTLRKRIQEKAGLRGEAEELYRGVIDLKVARWSSAAATRIGEMALDFRDGFKALPIPPELEEDSDEYFEYIAWMEDELIYPAEDAAIKGFQFSLDLAHQLKVYNEWSKKSAELLSRLSPDAWPVTSEEGVNTEHQGELLVEGEFVLGAMERGPKDAPKAPDAGEGSAGEGEDGGADTPAEDTPAEEAPAADETQEKDGEGESAEKAAEEASASN